MFCIESCQYKVDFPGPETHISIAVALCCNNIKSIFRYTDSKAYNATNYAQRIKFKLNYIVPFKRVLMNSVLPANKKIMTHDLGLSLANFVFSKKLNFMFSHCPWHNLNCFNTVPSTLVTTFL